MLFFVCVQCIDLCINIENLSDAFLFCKLPLERLKAKLMKLHDVNFYPHMETCLCELCNRKSLKTVTGS